MAEGATTLPVPFNEPGSPGTYTQMWWRKGNPPAQIVTYVPGINPNPVYQGEYCDISGCTASTRGSLNTNTGELTIRDLDYADNDYYYYSFSPDDTGGKYEIFVEVYGESVIYS